MKIMRGIFAAALTIPLLLLPVSAAEEPYLHSNAAILMEADTGQILYEKNAFARAYPASTTKIMTGILVTELCGPDEAITVSQSAIDIDEPESANIELVAGEQLTVNDAMYALMLASANDVANALAEHVAGSQQEFARMMTEKAAELGATDTVFQNAHGLHEDGHYTTARDMALITRYAMSLPRLMEYMSAEEYVIAATNLQSEPRELSNYHYMFMVDSFYYNPSVLGGKIGYTDEARHTMSTAASQDGRNLVCVVFDSDRLVKFEDTQLLFDMGFDDFREVTVPLELFETKTVPVMDGAETVGEVSYYAENEITLLLHKDYSLSDLQVQYPVKDRLEADETLPGSATLALDTGAGYVYPVLGEYPLSAEIYYEETYLTVPAMAMETPSDAAVWVEFLHMQSLREMEPQVILAAGGCALCVIVFFCVVGSRRRRRRQLERLNRRLRGGYSQAG